MCLLNEATQRQSMIHNNIETDAFIFFPFASKKSEVEKLKSMCLNSLNLHNLRFRIDLLELSPPSGHSSV